MSEKLFEKPYSRGRTTKDERPKVKEPNEPVEQYVFWDDEHFTTALHTQLAAQFVTTVQTSHGRSMQG
jgi:phospholipase/lecithinase/hemolysin